MKKILMTLAAVGLLFSCSKENAEPQLQPSTQDAAGIAAVDPNTPGAIRLSLDAEVAPFEVAQESYAEEQEGQAARGTRIDVGGPDVTKAITYRITPGADGKVPVVAFVYDNAGSVQVNGAKGEVTKDGKGLNIKFGTLLDPKVASSNSVLKRIANGTAKNPRLSILIGQDDDNQYFTNKGPQLVTYEAGKTKTLPDNFILMKATGIPLKYDAKTNLLSVANGAKISLTMQGYIIGARFHNAYPPEMLHFRWDNARKSPQPVVAPGMPKVDRYAREVPRPPIGIVFRIDHLSATYKARIALDPMNDRFDIGGDLLDPNQEDATIMTKRTTIPGLAPSNISLPRRPAATDVEKGWREHEHFLDATNIGEFFVPVRPLEADKFAEKEQFVVVYCPNPGDMGSVAYKSPMKLFYDDSPFSQIISPKTGRVETQPLANLKDSFRKKPTVRPENKFHFVTFKIAPTPLYGTNSIWNDDNEKIFKAYDQALEKYGLK